MMRRNKQFKKEKYIRSLIEKERELLKQRRTIREVEVPPYKNGWVVKAILREDIARSKDGEFLQSLLDIGYKETYIRNSKYVSLIRKKTYSYRLNKDTVINFFPERIKYTFKEYEKFTDRQKKYFTRHVVGHWNYHRVVYKIDVPLYYVNTKVITNYSTHMYIIDPDIESEYTRIHNKIESLNAYDIYYGQYYSSWDIKGYARHLEKVKLLKELKNYNI